MCGFKWRLNFLHYAFVSIFFLACSKENSDLSANPSSKVVIATTTSTVGSGLFDILIPEFEKSSGLKTEVHSLGTGAAIQLAKDGKADVILVHARKAEDQFVLDGFGINRRDVMFNDFVLLGPESSKLKEVLTKKETSDSPVIAALREIKESEYSFVSRGDNSGTNMRELALWKVAGLSLDSSHSNWYTALKKGMKATLKHASHHGSYVLSDRSTYLWNKDSVKLKIIVEGDRQLFNPYGVIAVNPQKHPHRNFSGAMVFVDYITSEEGQKVIGNYGINKFGSNLFTPMIHSVEK